MYATMKAGWKAQKLFAEKTGSLGNPYHDAGGQFTSEPNAQTVAGAADSHAGSVTLGSKEYKALPPEQKEALLMQALATKVGRMYYTKKADWEAKGFTDVQKAINSQIGKNEAIATHLATRAMKSDDPTDRRRQMHIALVCFKKVESLKKQLEG